MPSKIDRPSLLALAFFSLVPFLLGVGQELPEVPLHLDDYYFLMRSESFLMGGDFMAPIKEMLYPFFIRVTRAFGLSLRPTQAVVYGLALFALWWQVGALLRSRVAAWVTVLPLAFFVYQRVVLNRCTYDALQLALLPLTFAAGIALYRSSANHTIAAINGAVAALQIINRPEGLIFILPPLVALALCRSWPSLKIIALVLAIPLLTVQSVCAVNAHYFGYWATTAMKAPAFLRVMRGLMAIDPQSAPLKRVPVKETAFEMAFKVSPTFAQARPFFSKNLYGKGWAKAWDGDNVERQGGLPGGHYQWALYESFAYLTRGNLRLMNEAFLRVGDELDLAFATGRLRKRFVLASFLGPEFRFIGPENVPALRAIADPLLARAWILPAEIYWRPSNLVLRADYARLAGRREASARWYSVQNRIMDSFYFPMRLLIPLALLVALIFCLIPDTRPFAGSEISGALSLMWAMTAVVFLPRWLLFSGIHAYMYWGQDVRYMASGAFSTWVFATFTFAVLGLDAWRLMAKNKPRALQECLVVLVAVFVCVLFGMRHIVDVEVLAALSLAWALTAPAFFGRGLLIAGICAYIYWGGDPHFANLGLSVIWIFAAFVLAALGLRAWRYSSEDSPMKLLDSELRRQRVNQALRYLPGRFDRVLDIGCDDGYLLRRLVGRGLKLEGLDPKLLASSPAGMTLYQGAFPRDLTALGLRGPYDVIFATAVFEHFDEAGLQAAAAVMPDLLAPGGRLIITVPHPWVDKIMDALVRLRLADGMSLDEHHGFEPRELRRYFSELRFVKRRRFQLGLNNVFVFEAER